jgi:hypothetical protein
MKNNFFGVIAKSQTYLNMLYLLLSFPLGLFYFIFLITGISIGLGLIITWLSIPILLAVFFVWNGFAIFERQLTNNLLNTNIIYKEGKPSKEKKLLNKLKKHLSSSTSWKNLAYLLIKFPLGMVSFIFLTTFISISLSLIATPFLFHFSQIGLIPGPTFMQKELSFMNTYWFTIISGIVGIFIAFVSLHIFNRLAKISGLLAKTMLEKK